MLTPTAEVARLLGLSPTLLRSHVYLGNVVAPKTRVAGRLMWSRVEIEGARKALAVPGRRRPRKENRS